MQHRLFNSGTDLSNPVNQISARNYYFPYKNRDYRNNVILRVDEKPREGLSLAAEVILSAVYRRGRRCFGTGDSYVEALFTPWKTNYLRITVCGAMVLPTASLATLGSGKWQLAPIVIPLMYPLTARVGSISRARRLRNQCDLPVIFVSPGSGRETAGGLATRES
ncbi:MAG: hypothetical protein ACREQN_18920 [Candidatus Binataceae bacterium]